MTIEQRTNFLGKELNRKTLDPNPEQSTLFSFEKAINAFRIKRLTILSKDSIRLNDEFWPNAMFMDHSLVKELREEEINREEIQRDRFLRLVKQRIIWKP
jgi:hypothetical protein